MRKVMKTLDTTCTSLLSAAVRLAEAGQDEEARRLIDLAKALQDAEHEVLKHIKDARSGMIVKLSKH
jgi:urease accessory protein UreF